MSTTMSSTPIIRVCRKRSADPHTALVLSLKRHKADPVFFSLFKTSTDSLLSAQPNQPVIDFRPTTAVATHDPNDIANPLAFANDVVGEVGGPMPPVPRRDDDVIMVNDRPLVSASPVRDEFVFDFYRIAGGTAAAVVVTTDKADLVVDATSPDEWDMRFATKDEELMYGNDDSESDTGCRDDEDDSNEEDNWRNEYPEGEEEGDESGEEVRRGD